MEISDEQKNSNCRNRICWSVSGSFTGSEKSGNITLEIFVDPNHPERVNSPEAKGLRHVAVTVDKIEDLNMEIEEIRTDWFGRRFTFVKDPDGLPIEIKECGSTLK